MSAHPFLKSLIAFILLAPFFLLFIETRGAWSLPPWLQLIDVLVFTAVQAVLSALLALILGCLAGLGLLWAANRWGESAYRFLVALTLLPGAAPVIVVLLSVLSLFPWARGLGGIVFVHSLLNIGLVAVAFSRLVRSKVSNLSELAWLEGASTLTFLSRVVLPLLARDLALIGFFVFSLSFTSFAVPLTLGGGRATTIEVLIYQKIRLSEDWSQAVGLATLQMAFILAAAFVLRSRGSPAPFRRPVRTPLLQFAPGIALALLPLVVIAIGLFSDTLRGVAALLAQKNLLQELPRLLLGSVFVGTLVGFAVIAWLLLLAFVDPRGAFRRFLIGYAAPSSVLVGFSLLLLWPATGFASLIKISLGLVLISVPAFYRLEWDATLRGLRGQRSIAKLLGASDAVLFWQVLFPQLIRPASVMAGLASIWAWGDFALSAVVAERALTTAMTVRSLMDSYRLDAALALVWIVIAGGVMNFLFFTGVGRVLGAKSQT